MFDPKPVIGSHQSRSMTRSQEASTNDDPVVCVKLQHVTLIVYSLGLDSTVRLMAIR